MSSVLDRHQKVAGQHLYCQDDAVNTPRFETLCGRPI